MSYRSCKELFDLDVLKNERTRAGFIVGSLPFIGEGDNRYNSYYVFFFFHYFFRLFVLTETNNFLFVGRICSSFFFFFFCNSFRSFTRWLVRGRWNKFISVTLYFLYLVKTIEDLDPRIKNPDIKRNKPSWKLILLYTILNWKFQLFKSS